jgi:hypothetical protein
MKRVPYARDSVNERARPEDHLRTEFVHDDTSSFNFSSWDPYLVISGARTFMIKNLACPQ